MLRGCPANFNIKGTGLVTEKPYILQGKIDPASDPHDATWFETTDDYVEQREIQREFEGLPRLLALGIGIGIGIICVALWLVW